MIVSAFAIATVALLPFAYGFSKSPLFSCLLRSASQGIACPDSVPPFHLLCGPLNAAEAADACSSQGWQLAVLDDSNKFEALWQIRNCTPANAWIDSFNGVSGEDCFQFRGDVPIIETDLPRHYCRDKQQAVLCEDVPVETITRTRFISTTTDFETKTKTKVIHPTCPSGHCKPRKPHHKDSEFVILEERLPFAKAECACKQLDMTLADLNIFNFLDASFELWKDLGPNRHGWIRSWNGDKYDHKTCLALWTGSAGPNGAIAQPRNCHEHSPVVCQRLHRPVCPCKPKDKDCHCFRPHVRHPILKAEKVPQPPKAEQRIFLQAEPLPIFSGPHEKEEYEEKVAWIKQHQESQDELEMENDIDEAEEELEAEDAEEKEMLARDADHCIRGEGPCPKVCSHRTDGIRVIKTNATAYEGEFLCSRFGWTLLDYHDSEERSVRFLKGKCGGFERGFWIRSFNGVDGGACMLINSGIGVPVGWVISADDCIALGRKYVLCQTGKPIRTTSGTHSGMVTFTTITTVGTLTTTSFIRTVTTTVTHRK